MMEEGVKCINSVKEEEFLSLLGNIVEHTPKVALQLYKLKPFPDATALINSLSQAVDSLSQEEKVRSDHFIVRLTSVSMTSWESWVAIPTWLVDLQTPTCSLRSPPGSRERRDWTASRRRRRRGWGATMSSTGTSLASHSSSAPGRTKQPLFWMVWTKGCKNYLLERKRESSL